jgi:hypothetical protein
MWAAAVTSSMLTEIIPGLRGSPLHQMCVALYQRHRDDDAGACTRCAGRSPCPPRCRAASVIEAAGEAPGCYDASAASRELAIGLPDDVQVLSANAVGYRVGNADRVRVPDTWERS